MIELTSRANLQLRGISEDAYAALLGGLHALGLIDPSTEQETRRNLILSPFSAARPDQESMADGLIAGLMRPGMPDLPAKFGFVIDAAPGRRHISTASGDIRIESGEHGLIVRADGAAFGRRVDDEDEAIELVVDMVRWFAASGGIKPDGRGRMRRHLEDGAELPGPLEGDTEPAPPAPALRPGRIGKSIAIGAPFGLFRADQLRLVADVTKTSLHITPYRMIMVESADMASLERDPDLILSPHDPLLRVVGCTGAPACPQGKIETRALARALAPLTPDDETLHVSGCSKGCANPNQADITIVGRSDGYAIIETGSASDLPAAAVLSLEELMTLMSKR
jgi:precorrin-3B synthase